jgi:hypothetical protein
MHYERALVTTFLAGDRKRSQDERGRWHNPPPSLRSQVTEDRIQDERGRIGLKFL